MNSGPLSDWREEGIPNLGRISVRIRQTTVGAHLLVVGKALIHPEKRIYKDKEKFNPFDGWHVGEIYLPVLWGKMSANLVGGERGGQMLDLGFVH